jgi:hypothetical protein
MPEPVPHDDSGVPFWLSPWPFLEPPPLPPLDEEAE